MKKIMLLFAGLLIMPALAEVAPVAYYDEEIEYTDEYIADDEDAPLVEQTVAVAPIAAVAVQNNRAQVARTATRQAPSVDTAIAPTRATLARPVSSRTAGAAISRGVEATSVSRVSNSGQPSGVSSRRVAAPAPTVGRVALIQTDTVSAPIYNGRIGVRNTNPVISTRTSAARIATSGALTTTETTTDTAQSLESLSKITDLCKIQFTQCMDNFCSVLDDNQGRCSCSANLKNYSKTEEGLKQATEDLQDIAQKIQYIGLTKDEVLTLFNQTEAEATMQGRTDNTQLKSDLDKVKTLIFDVKSATTASSDSSMNLDLSGLLDFSFDSNGFDLSELFGDTTNNSISNQRGIELFKTATNRCKSSILDSCKSQGVDTAIITNSYDLEIDKQCIAYERSLDDANLQMNRTVRNAKGVLQKARLIVAQQKNTYDLRGCVTALDACMQDDFICGTNYQNCLDPTGKYIANGKIVIGSKPGVSGGKMTSTTTSGDGIYSTWNYSAGTVASNAWGAGTISGFISTLAGADTPVATNLVGFFEQKIGYNKDGKNFGMCVSVLNKCQDVTYDKTGYIKKNKAVEAYLERTLVMVKTSQDEMIADYAENCVNDVTSCLIKNNWVSTATTAVKNAAEKACSSYINTCASTTDNQASDIVVQAATAL